MSWARKRKRSENIDWLMRQTPAQSARYLRREDARYDERQAAKLKCAATDVYNRVKQEAMQRVEAELKKFKESDEMCQHANREGISWAVCVFAAFLRDGHIGAPFGAKRLEKFIADINAYMDDLVRYKITGEDIAVTLKDEIGIDLEEEFAKADKASQEAKKCRNTAS